MLPGDAKEHRQVATDKNAQSMVTNHFKPQSDEDKPIVYSDKLFASAAIKWLIDADLVSVSFSPVCCTVLIASCIFSHFKSSAILPSRGWSTLPPVQIDDSSYLH